MSDDEYTIPEGHKCYSVFHPSKNYPEGVGGGIIFTAREEELDEMWVKFKLTEGYHTIKEITPEQFDDYWYTMPW